MSEPEFDYEIKFVISAKDDQEAMDKFHDAMQQGTDQLIPDVKIIEDDNYNNHFGYIKPEGTI